MLMMALLVGTVSAIDAADDVSAKPKVTVYVVSAGLSDDEKRVLGTKILNPFVKSKQYTVVERNDAFLRELDAEMKTQMSGSVDDNQISRLGKHAGVDFVCVADLVAAFGIYSVTARLINTETAVIVGMGETEMKALNEIGGAAEEIFRQIIGEGGASTASNQSTVVAQAPVPTARQGITTAQNDGAAYQGDRRRFEPEYKNFGSGARAGAFCINAYFPGVGSIAIMKDWKGAGVQWGLAGGAILCLAGGASMTERKDRKDRRTIMTIGGILYGADVVFNFVRTATYKKPHPQTHAHSPYGDLNLAVFPDHQGNVNAGLVYSLEF